MKPKEKAQYYVSRLSELMEVITNYMPPTETSQNGWPEQPQGGFSNKPLTNYVKLHGGDISPTLYFLNYSGLAELPQHIRRLVFHKAHFRITVTNWLTHDYELRPPRRSWPLGKLTLK
jgi:hypothetical protein